MKRVVTATLLIPIVLSVIIWGSPLMLFAGVAIVAVICFSEYRGIASGYGVGKLGPLGYAAGLALLAIDRLELLLLVLFALLALTLTIRFEGQEKTLPWASVLTLGVLYIFGPW